MPCIVASEHQKSLAELIARKMQCPLIVPKTVHFADSEIRIDFKEVHYECVDHAIIVHATSPPVHDNLMWLFLTCQQLKQQGIKRITAVVPYFGYGRQDKHPNGTVGAVQLVAQLFEAAGIDQIITVALHAPEIVRYFSMPILNVDLSSCITRFIQDIYKQNRCTLIAPDKGAMQRVASIATQIDAPIVTIEKERHATNQTRIVDIKGTCSTECALIVDDIIDTGSTIIDAARALQQKHQDCIISAFGIHPVLSAKASDRLQQSALSNVWVTNTIEVPADVRFEKLEVIDVSSEIVTSLKSVV